MATYDRYSPHYPLTAYLWPLLFLVALAGLVAWRFWPRDGGAAGPYSAPREVTPRGDLAADEMATIALYQKAAPSVVHITALSVERDAFSLNVQQIPRGTGSGIIWSKEGHIVTNSHVIQSASAAQVHLADHSTWNATLVGSYPDKDLAVLKISAPTGRLRPIEVGTSDNLQVGQKAFAIGNPFGLDQTLTTGVVSALNREIESGASTLIRGVIQTDAAINPGNSGGPLLDSFGRLIGVNTAIYSPSGASAGIGFAIPVDEVNRIVPQLIKNGKVVKPGLGVQVATDQVTLEHDLPGVLVLVVVPNGPAAKAGLQPTRRTRRGFVLGDVITAVDGKPVKKAKELFLILEQYKVGDTVTVKVSRQGDELEVPVTLEAV
jgi:S1-C subfamily serine protease